MTDELRFEQREITFHFPELVNEVEPTGIAQSFKRAIFTSEQLNFAAHEVLRDASSELGLSSELFEEENIISWFDVNLLKPGITPEQYSGPSDDIAVRFGVSSCGPQAAVQFHSGHTDSYRLNSLDDLDLLASWGLVHGQRDHLIIRPAHGRGGSTYFGDLVSWLLDQGVDVAVELARDILIYRLISPLFSRIRNGKRDRKARKIAVRWNARGLEAPYQLREFIDFKNEWTPDEVSKRLRIPKEASRQLLKALGLEADSRGEWRPGTSKRSKKRRKQWESAERDADYGESESED